MYPLQLLYIPFRPAITDHNRIPKLLRGFQKPAIRDIEQMQRPVYEIHPLLRDSSSGLLQKLNLEPHGANGRDAVQFGRPDDARLFG